MVLRPARAWCLQGRRASSSLARMKALLIGAPPAAPTARSARFAAALSARPCRLLGSAAQQPEKYDFFVNARRGKLVLNGARLGVASQKSQGQAWVWSSDWKKRVYTQDEEGPLYRLNWFATGTVRRAQGRQGSRRDAQRGGRTAEHVRMRGAAGCAGDSVRQRQAAQATGGPSGGHLACVPARCATASGRKRRNS